MIRAVPHVAAMAPYALADLGGEGTISLAQNESAFAASPAAIAAGKAVLEQMPLYPDPEWPELRAAVAEVHSLDPANVLCGAGSMELIGCLIRAFAGPGDQVLGTDYGYAFVASASAQVQADYVKARERELTVSVYDILPAVTPETRIVFVCNPGNPTGTLIPNSDLLRLREGLPADVLLVVDQAYAEFADADNDPAEIFALVERGDTVVMRTLSKAYGLAGARAGWGYFPPEIAGEVRKLLNPNNISIPSQAMAAAAMRDQAHMHDVVSQTAAIRDGFSEGCRALGLEVPQSHTNFVLIRFASPDQAKAADAALRAEKLLMRGMGGYGLDDCLRATICSQEVMDRALAVLEGVLK
ncbi:pyridoxal phosphate-dependent aminotransferase [Leisingera sp. D0M16]|uniref:pyridoxal phosphate-dependent aminotransferase n=1 Tax=Leisingera coralii TaxID=3351347 RepID=UPI003B7FFB58